MQNGAKEWFTYNCVRNSLFIDIVWIFVCIHNRTSNSLSSKICSIRRGNTSLNPCTSWNTMHTAVNIISKQSLRRSKEYSHIQTSLTRYCYTHIHAHLTPPHYTCMFQIMPTFLIASICLLILCSNRHFISKLGSERVGDSVDMAIALSS